MRVHTRKDKRHGLDEGEKGHANAPVARGKWT